MWGVSPKVATVARIRLPPMAILAAFLVFWLVITIMSGRGASPETTAILAIPAALSAGLSVFYFRGSRRRAAAKIYEPSEYVASRPDSSVPEERVGWQRGFDRRQLIEPGSNPAANQYTGHWAAESGDWSRAINIALDMYEAYGSMGPGAAPSTIPGFVEPGDILWDGLRSWKRSPSWDPKAAADLLAPVCSRLREGEPWYERFQGLLEDYRLAAEDTRPEHQ